MKIKKGDGNFLRKLNYILARAVILAGFLFCAFSGRAQAPGDYTNGPTYTPLASWSFHDSTNWTSDQHDAPVSFTNLDYSYLGNGSSLVVDSTNQTWLQYNVVETNGTTNLTVDVGTVSFWFAPNWSSTNEGGIGPGDWERLFEVGSYTADSSYGWWSVYVDPDGANIYFSAQTNDLSSNACIYLSAPIAWTTNNFHFIALTYSTTNTALYLDGSLATNGPPLIVYPGADVLTNGFFIGSDSNGVSQAHGLFNKLVTYGEPMDADTIQQIFISDFSWLIMNPYNAMFNISSAPSTPSPLLSAYDIITGQGGLQLVGSVTAITSTNVWMTNVTASATSGAMTLRFTIQGGSNGVPYDVFANSVLDFSSSTNRVWAWMGQGYHGNSYTLTNLPNTACFLILGTSQDSDFDGLTDAYERLVSKTNPNNADTDGDGISDSDEILGGTNPLISGPGWKLDTDNDGLPDTYETFVGWNPNSAEVAPVLPSYSMNPIQ